MKDLTITDSNEILPNLPKIMAVADVLAKSTMVPKQYQGQPANVVVAVLWGQDLGLHPLQAMQNIAVINGRPSLWGDAMLAVVMASPMCESIEETLDGQEEEMVASCIAKRAGQNAVTRTFSVSDAKKAGLWDKDGPWKTYPQRMLRMRARSWALRDAFPDLLRGINSVEESRDIPEEKDVGGIVVINEIQKTAIENAAKFHGWSEDDVLELLGEYGYTKIEDILADQCDRFLARLRARAVPPKPPKRQNATRADINELIRIAIACEWPDEDAVKNELRDLGIVKPSDLEKSRLQEISQYLSHGPRGSWTHMYWMGTKCQLTADNVLQLVRDVTGAEVAHGGVLEEIEIGAIYEELDKRIFEQQQAALSLGVPEDGGGQSD